MKVDFKHEILWGVWHLLPFPYVRLIHSGEGLLSIEAGLCWLDRWLYVSLEAK